MSFEIIMIMGLVVLIAVALYYALCHTYGGIIVKICKLIESIMDRIKSIELQLDKNKIDNLVEEHGKKSGKKNGNGVKNMSK